MKEKKNIDRLFQEKFKNFEEQPSSDVWAKIAATQQQKKGRNIIPLWWKLGGIAAALAILFGLGNFFSDSNTQTSPEIVGGTTIEDGNEKDNSNNTDGKQTEIVLTRDDFNDNVSEEEISETQINTSTSLASSNTTTNSDAKQNNIILNTDVVTTNVNKNQGTTTNRQRTGKPSDTNKNKSQANTNKGLIAYTKEGANAPNNSSVQPLQMTAENTTRVTSKETPTYLKEETAVADNSTNEGKQEIKKDLVAEAKKIEESLQNEEEVAQVEDKEASDRWDVGAIAAPVYYGDFGGSGLDARFTDNDKSGDVNLSYGVQVSYAVTPKFKIRTGVSNLDLSYNTNEIQFSTNGLGGRVQGLDYADNAKTLAISDNSAPTQNNTQVDGFGPLDFDNKQDGSLVQQLNYIEVPVEAVYVLSDKRLGVSVVGGVSTLFLNDNDVILEATDISTSLGTATGANDISFTTNFGVGLDYKMTDKLKLNIEPSIKYQLNSFDESVGDFKPYYLGVYTGISYRF